MLFYNFSLGFQWLMIGWFFLSYYLIFKDNAIDVGFKKIGYVVNLFSQLYIYANITEQNTEILFYTVGGALFSWYLFWIAVDANNPDYTWFEKTVYTTVNVIMIFYTSATMSVQLAKRAGACVINDITVKFLGI